MCVFITTLLTYRAKFVILPRFTVEGFLQTIQVINQKELAKMYKVNTTTIYFFIFCFHFPMKDSSNYQRILSATDNGISCEIIINFQI